MHSFMDAKLMAKLLRQALADRNIAVTHSESLELVARQFGLADWNMLAAKIEAAAVPDRNLLPKGWIVTGPAARYYRTGIDHALSAAWIKSIPALADNLRDGDACTVMQSVNAANFRGQRLRLATRLKCRDVEGNASIFFRIDGPDGTLRFENLWRYGHESGTLQGTSDWQARHIVLDVPAAATTLNYGFLLAGRGEVWCRGFALEPVDDSVPVNTPETYALGRPENLSFVEAP